MTILWSGDFETGDKTQWEAAQAASPDRLQIVTSPVHQGKYALRVEVRNGDFVSSGNRAELVRTKTEKEGDDRYYAWATMWPMDYPSEATWQLFTQWHHTGSTGSPPFEMYVNGEKMYLRVQASTVLWTGSLERGKWHDFILHVKWSSDPGIGFVELWYDGVNVLPKKAAATMYAGQENYLKQGLYRDSAIKPVGVIFHDGMRMATTLDDVWPKDMDAGVGDAIVAETSPSDTGAVEDTSVAADTAAAVDSAPAANDIGVADTTAPTSEDGSCGCSTPGRTSTTYGWLFALIMASASPAARRRAAPSRRR